MIKVLFQLFYNSKTPLIKISIILLPILLILVIASLLFIHNLLYSYKNYLEKSYIGLQPKIYIESTPKFIDKLYNYAKNHNITASKAIHIYHILKIDNNYKKKIEFIVLDKNFMLKKYHTTLAINNILARDIKSQATLSNKNIKKPLIITNKTIIPTGFLTNSSIIFISKSKYIQHFKNIPKENILEIEDNLNQDIIKKYAKELEVMQLKIKHRIKGIDNSKKLFNKIEKIKIFITILIFLFAISIITISFSIIIEIKRKEIEILHKIGISKDKFYIFLLFISFVILSISILIGYLLYIFTISFLKEFLTNTYDFVIISDNHFLLYLLSFIPFSIFITFISLKNTRI